MGQSSRPNLFYPSDVQFFAQSHVRAVAWKGSPKHPRYLLRHLFHPCLPPGKKLWDGLEETALRPCKNSPALPPRPWATPGRGGRSATVVSPPLRTTHGRANGYPLFDTERAIAACTFPTSRDSPSMSPPRMCTGKPAARTFSAAASKLCFGVAIRWHHETRIKLSRCDSAPSNAGGTLDVSHKTSPSFYQRPV